MRHARWLIILCVAVVIVFTALCCRALFAVSDVYVECSVYDESETAVVNEIVNGYKNKLLPFVKEKEIIDKLNSQTKLKVLCVEKRYPNALFVSVEQREERFAVKDLGGYCIFDNEYNVIEHRDTLANSSDKLDNILLEFEFGEFDFQSLRQREALDIGNDALLDSVKLMVSKLDSPRDCIKEIRVEEKDAGNNYYVYFTTLEGVEIEIRKALEKSEDKITVGFEKYLELSDADKLKAKIAVYELDSGEIKAVFTTN